ncbi:LicD family protein [Isoptericola dokdonensis]|uniref:LicD family protein n=1 Tax=Isoptericola dokdonensis DS-3 TaxID=1300344 RepID=A0A161I180_9MICO|nr:LicD family protein [Isoptericola dokdonensis]ANC32863.1 LicD family protein [Isoptericola dokdonensis DS-3]
MPARNLRSRIALAVHVLRTGEVPDEERGGADLAAGAPAVREPSALADLPGTVALLPSLGYFGGIAANHLSVPVPGPVREVRLFLPPQEAGQIDLRGVELYRAGRRIDPVAAGGRVEQSSDTTKDDRSPFALGGIRTAKETGPWWRVGFDVPVAVDEVRVYNRLDGFGHRNRRLTVAVADGAGRYGTVVTVDSDRVVRRTLALLERLTGIGVPKTDLDAVATASATREAVVAALAARAREGLLTTDPVEQRLLVSLVPLEPVEGRDLGADDWALLGHVLAAERLRVPATATSIRTFHLQLRTRARLERLTGEVNAAGAVVGTPEAVLSRHGIVDQSGLRKQSEQYLDTIERASALLGGLGYPTMLAYGTLLGAVREGDFLAHDDDVDLMVPLDVPDRAAAEPVLEKLRSDLREAGWKVSRPNTYTNFHLHDPSTGLHVDVFPLFVDGERLTLHMEGMRLRTIPASVVVPPAPLTLRGRRFLGPADPEAFLAERYGEGWSVADPFYDWPWRLDG